MSFMRLIQGVPDGVELNIGDIHIDDIQQQIDKYGLYPVIDITDYSDNSKKTTPEKTYSLVNNIINKTVQLINKTVDELKAEKIAELSTAFEDSLTFVELNGISWIAGLDSAQRLDGAKRLTELMGLDSVIFTDKDRTPHTLTLLQADDVIKAVGIDFQVKFIAKQNAVKAVIDLPANATQVDIDAIVL